MRTPFEQYFFQICFVFLLAAVSSKKRMRYSLQETEHDDTTAHTQSERRAGEVWPIGARSWVVAHADELLHVELQRRLRECEQVRCVHRQHRQDMQQALVEPAEQRRDVRESCYTLSTVLCPCMARASSVPERSFVLACARAPGHGVPTGGASN